MEPTPNAVQIAQMPAALPPPGVKPNPVDPYTTGPIAIVICSILLFIMLVFVSIRLYVKLKIVRKFTPDDCKYFGLTFMDALLTLIDTCIVATVIFVVMLQAPEHKI